MRSAVNRRRRSATTTLRGVTWNHTRGYLPMLATAQRFCELNAGIEIVWDKHSLQAFEEVPVLKLAKTYDLMVIDHPHIGDAAQSGALIALDDYLPSRELFELSANSVGASHNSYSWRGHQWALAIDGACPVMAWREDLLERRRLPAPKSWSDILELAQRGGVEIPSAPVNSLLQFLGLCVTLGSEPCEERARLVEPDAGERALVILREVVALCDPACFGRDPIQSLNLLANANNRQICVCLFPFGYSNYARRGYAAHRLKFGVPPSHRIGHPHVTVLGGTGLAVSALSAERENAIRFASYVASSDCQCSLYTDAGGQPAHRSAWLDGQNNRITSNYFRATLPAVERAWLRPRHGGFLRFQCNAGSVVNSVLAGTIREREGLLQLDKLWRSVAA